MGRLVVTREQGRRGIFTREGLGVRGSLLPWTDLTGVRTEYFILDVRLYILIFILFYNLEGGGGGGVFLYFTFSLYYLGYIMYKLVVIFNYCRY